MPKINPEDLARIKEETRRTSILRQGSGRAKITVHMGTCGIAAGARKIMNKLMKLIEEKGIDDIILTTSGCAGLCSREPMATVELQGSAPVKYIDLTEKKIEEIFEQHVQKGIIKEEYALGFGSERTE
jgi:NADP-reducing hydrogenase subunit HndB